MLNNFLFVSAENDSISGCKAGGMGDVLRDVPVEIASRGDKVSVVTPAYSRLHAGQEFVSLVTFNFRGVEYSVELYKVTPKNEVDSLSHYVIHHSEIRSGNIAHIYFDDPEQPFYQDACMFALFCIAVAQCVKDGLFGELNYIHMHDWHTSLLLFLREYNQDYTSLKSIKTIYSIHNLAIQGIRPFENNYSSLKAFYPNVDFDYDRLKDNRYEDCVNLMATGIRLADKVHTVSPSYMNDIQRPSNWPVFVGGEGLENDLKLASENNKLFGVLNACTYNNLDNSKSTNLILNCVQASFRWLLEPTKDYKSQFLVHTGDKISRLFHDKPSFICTSIARLTEQKFFFFKNNPQLLKDILAELLKINGYYFLLGTGAPDYEEFFRAMSYEHPNFIFINGQSEDVINSLYKESDLYLMPSLFEPCGISQMLAMRNGQPCLVHGTGGLKDTVKHLKNGFVFEGDTFSEKEQSFLANFKLALGIKAENNKKWKTICENARLERFTWENSVSKYYKFLY